MLSLLLPAVGALSALPARAVAPAWHTWRGSGTNVYRSAQYDQGEWIYSNGILQAQGANADGLHRTDYYSAFGSAGDVNTASRDLYLALTYDFFGAHRASHNGDYQLPTDRTTWPAFTADLAELRLAVEGDQLFIRLLWNSMPRPDAQVATITFASAGAAPPTTAWPLNAGVRSPWQRAITLWGSGGQVATTSSAQALAAAGGDTRTGDHVTEARVPLSALPPGPWTLTGGSGLDDPAAIGQYWTVPAGSANASHPGSGFATAPGANVWDLLFAGDTPWTFDERRQADDLVGGDVGSDNATVDPALLAAGASARAPVQTGDLSRFFSSRLSGPDGFEITGNTSPVQPPPAYLPPLPTDGFNVNFLYTGRLQPYYMHVPATYPARTSASPLIVYLHGFTGLPDEPFYNPVGLVQAADAHGYLLASALGRGDYFYRGPGDVDVQEVIADVEAHYNVDRNRIYLMGHSMGGYGTDNVGMHHPDLFAALAPAEGTDSIALNQNLLNTPWFVMTADEDLDIMGQQANLLYSDLSARGYDATLLQYHLKIHEYSSIYDTLPRLFAYFGSHVRNPNPPVVSYSRLPGEDVPAIGLVYDHAYWLSGLRPADANKPSTTRVESFGVAHADLDPTHAVVTVDPNDDEHGPDGRSAGVLKQTVPAYGPTIPARNAIRVATTNDSAATVDLARAGVRLDCALAVDSDADSALSLRLAGVGPASVALVLDGAAQPALQRVGGAYALSLPAGRHTATIGAGACPTTAGGLPNTGASWPAAGWAVILLVVAGLVGLLGSRWRVRGQR
jgi:predicted esterase